MPVELCAQECNKIEYMIAGVALWLCCTHINMTASRYSDPQFRTTQMYSLPRALSVLLMSLCSPNDINKNMVNCANSHLLDLILLYIVRGENCYRNRENIMYKIFTFLSLFIAILLDIQATRWIPDNCRAKIVKCHHPQLQFLNLFTLHPLSTRSQSPENCIHLRYRQDKIRNKTDRKLANYDSPLGVHRQVACDRKIKFSVWLIRGGK